MRRFVKQTALIEEALKTSKDLFNKGATIDFSRGGGDWELEDIFLVLENYAADETIRQGEVVTPKNMKEFIEKVWDALWMMSQFPKQKVKEWLKLNEGSFVKFKLEERNRCKQLYFIKIVNEICNQIYRFDLIKQVD